MDRKTVQPKASNPVITSIETQSRHADRVSIFLDGSFFCGLSAVGAARLKLKKGMILTAESLTELQQTVNIDSAIQFTLRSLARTNQPSPRLRDKLKVKGFSEEIIGQTLTYLKDSGYLNDESYIKSFISDAIHLKKWGRDRILPELRKRGFQREEVEEYLPLELEVDLSAIKDQVKRRFGKIHYLGK